MSEFIQCNKLAGVYWLQQPLEDVTIKIKLKHKESISMLPKFEEYKEKSNEEHLQILASDKIETYTFKWQQKTFSTWEIQKYSDDYNCNTEIELKYRDLIKEFNYQPKKIFTYINEDFHLPLPFRSKKRAPNLNDCFNNLNLEMISNYGDWTSSTGYLFRSEENLCYDEEQWIAMHVVLDSSEYNEELQLLYKDENILVSLYHNITCNYLIVCPDVIDLQYKAYSVENQTGLEYGVEIDFGKESGTEEKELVDLLNNLLRKWEKKKKNLMNFVMPPLGRRKFFVSFEIVSAVDFENDKLYIEFNIKIPDDLQCNGDQHGRTHTSKYIKTEDSYEWKYGHIIELELECTTGIDPAPLKIFLEAISVDWWGRHRTEGYSCLSLSLGHGDEIRHLSCSRPEELDTVEANNRRFFVGGCHLIKDLDVLANPQLHDTNFKYISSGTITVRWSTISQSQSPGSLPAAPETSASALINGAEAVLRQYKKAKATLAAATRSVPDQIKGCGDG